MSLGFDTKCYKYKHAKAAVCSHMMVTNGAIVDMIAKQPLAVRMFEKEFIRSIGGCFEEITRAEFFAAKIAAGEAM